MAEAGQAGLTAGADTRRFGRLEPPSPARPSLLRARLVDLLARRWDHRLVTVVAGPGFGKTTLLAQGLAENALAPRGLDLWLSCIPEDEASASLAAAVEAALGLDPQMPRAEITASRVVDEVHRRAPLHVCLLVDDAHMVPAGSSGAAWLADLVAHLPANGHVVLAGRDGPPVPSARLRALGQVAAIGEDDLAFDDDETAAFAALRVADRDAVSGSAGWPALAELLAATDQPSAGPALDFIREEVLGALPPARRRHLAVLAAIGSADDHLLSAAAAEPLRVRDVTRAVPLAAVTAEGWGSLHELWEPALATVLAPAERDAARRRAAASARHRGDVVHALRLYADAGAWDDVRDLVLVVCSDSHPLVAPDVLAVWHRRLVGAGLQDTAEAWLLHGAIRKPTDPLGAVPSFVRAARGFHADSNRDGEAVCLFHQGHVFWWHEDIDGLTGLVERAWTLAEGGSSLAASLVGVGALVLAEIAGDADGLVAGASTFTREHLHPEIAPIADWLAARGSLMLGDPAAAEAPARRALRAATPTMRAAAEVQWLACRWGQGAAEEVLARLDGALAGIDDAGWAHNRAADGAQAAMWCALAGELERATGFLEAARRSEGAAGRWARALLGLAGAVLAVSRGDEAEARALLAIELAERPLTEPSVARAHRTWVAVSAVLVPSTLGTWQGADLRGVHAEALLAATVLADLRERGGWDSDAVAALARVPAGHVRAFLPVPWRVELAAVLAAAGRDEAAGALLVGAGSGARSVLHRLRDSVPAVADGATRLADAHAEHAHLEIGVLGPLRLLVDGEECWPEQLNRRAVRELLFLLVTHGPITRARAAATLWPDLAEGAGRNNLRVTLSYLNRALDPDRDPRAQGGAVGERGEQLRLSGDNWVTVDVHRFEESLAHARRLEHAGSIDAAIERYLEAVAMYRGDYLADSDAEWVEPARSHLRTEVVRSGVRAGELLVARGRADHALELATRAIGVERWSEPARRLFAEACAALGDRAGAARSLTDCAAVLDELGVGPEPETAMLARRLGLTTWDRT
jgi:LuxR family transcriptional regulator, maltose regulon positive regulatory protein